MATATETTAEFSVVLDVPEDVADRLNHFLDSEPTAAAHSADIPVSLEVKKDGATLTVDGVALPTAVSTLPTVVEAYKSFDNVNFYKTSEVSQMLVARHTKEDLPQQQELADGLTPPAANIRKRMWRKRPRR